MKLFLTIYMNLSNQENFSKFQKEKYYDIKTDIIQLLKGMGIVSDLKMSITFVACGSGDNLKYYILFCPYITGMEKVWNENGTRPWDHQYYTHDYRCDIPYFYIRDDFLHVPVELYTYINENELGFCICEYNEKEKSLKILKNLYQHLKYKIKSEIDTFKVDTMEILFESPMKNHLPFPVKNILISYPSNGTTFFKLELTSRNSKQ